MKDDLNARNPNEGSNDDDNSSARGADAARNAGEGQLTPNTGGIADMPNSATSSTNLGNTVTKRDVTGSDYDGQVTQ